MAAGRKELHHRLVAVRLLEVEDRVELALGVLLARGRALVLGNRGRATSDGRLATRGRRSRGSGTDAGGASGGQDETSPSG
jgi:hypothetical protein